MVDIVRIQNILNGDKKAENELYLEYINIIRAYLIKNYPKNKNDLDDNVSEILIKMFMNLNKYDCEKSKLKSWVISIIKNHMIDKWRNSITKYEVDETYQTNTYSNINFVSNNVTEFDYNDYLQCLSKQISCRDFTLLEMKYMQGYSYDEIGDMFNITSTTVSNRVNYVKTKIKKCNFTV